MSIGGLWCVINLPLHTFRSALLFFDCPFPMVLSEKPVEKKKIKDYLLNRLSQLVIFNLFNL